MELIYPQVQQTKKSFSTELLHSLVQYLNQSEEAPTLRQLKATFKQPNFEKCLEEFIDAGWVLRRDRRYFLIIPWYSMKEIEQMQAKLKDEVQHFMSKEEAEQGRLLFTYFQRLELNKTLYGVDEAGVLGNLFCAGNQGVKLLTMTKTTAYEKTLPCFFAHNRQVDQAALFGPLDQLLGDVDEEYFFDQVELILSRVQKRKKNRPSIFLEALEATAVVAEAGGMLNIASGALGASDALVDEKSDVEIRLFLAMILTERAKNVWQIVLS
ncbi:MAG: DUF1803 domain-containing protein [Enterococcus sp.]